MYPAPAKLRRECLAAFRKEILKKDRKIRGGFFAESGDDGAVIKKIKGYGVDGLKPLPHFLKGRTTKPDHKNVELLAWLTDFGDRPYDDRKAYGLEDLPTGVTTPGEIIDAEGEAEKEKQIEEKKMTELELVEEPAQLPATVVVDKVATQAGGAEEKVPLVVWPLTVVKRRAYPKAIIVALLIVVSTVVGFVIHLTNGEKGIIPRKGQISACLRPSGPICG